MKAASEMLNGLPLVVRDSVLMMEHATGGRTCQEWEELGKVWPTDGADVAEAVVDALFCQGGADPWLRVGDGNGWAMQGRRSALRGVLQRCAWIAPNAAAGPRQWLVIGFILREEVDGLPGPDAAVLSALRSHGRTLSDFCTGALLDLTKYAPLGLVVADGPEGLLEGWFFCQGADPALLRAFMGQAMRRGAVDSISEHLPPWMRPYAREGWVQGFQSGMRMLSTVKHWNPTSPVLMPGGRGADGAFQPIRFFRPEVVQA